MLRFFIYLRDLVFEGGFFVSELISFSFEFFVFLVNLMFFFDEALFLFSYIIFPVPYIVTSFFYFFFEGIGSLLCLFDYVFCSMLSLLYDCRCPRGFPF